ncbi:hypothetical protein GW17_00005058, partial [Ensete ventricosum]
YYFSSTPISISWDPPGLPSVRAVTSTTSKSSRAIRSAEHITVFEDFRLENRRRYPCLVSSDRRGKRGMGAPVVRFPIVPLIRLTGAAAAALVIIWAVHFRGGLALISDNKDLIFNVTSFHLLALILIVTLLWCYCVNASSTMVIGGWNLSGKTRTARYIPVRQLTGMRTGRSRAVHPVLMVIGFILLNGEGVLYVNALVTYHLTWGVYRFLFYQVIFNFHCVQWGMGFATFWYPGGSRSSRAFLLPWHVFFGVYIYALAIVTAITGLLEKATFLQASKTILRYSNEAFLINSLGISLILLGGFVILALVSLGTARSDLQRGNSE